jgi:hypothetical protein
MYSSTLPSTSALDGVLWSTPRSGRFTPGKGPFYRRLGGPQGWSGRVRKISPTPGFDLRTVHPVASPYTDWAILATPFHRVFEMSRHRQAEYRWHVFSCLARLCVICGSTWCQSQLHGVIRGHRVLLKEMSVNCDGGILCYLTKALDCLNHDTLLSKLNFGEITGKANGTLGICIKLWRLKIKNINHKHFQTGELRNTIFYKDKY